MGPGSICGFKHPGVMESVPCRSRGHAVPSNAPVSPQSPPTPAFLTEQISSNLICVCVPEKKPHLGLQLCKRQLVEKDSTVFLQNLLCRWWHGKAPYSSLLFLNQDVRAKVPSLDYTLKSPRELLKIEALGAPLTGDLNSLEKRLGWEKWKNSPEADMTHIEGRAGLTPHRAFFATWDY